MEALKQVEGLVSAKLSVIKAVLSLIRLEARLAGMSVFPLLLNICLILIVSMTFWLVTSVLIGYEIFVVSNDVPLSIFLVFLLNLGVLLVLAKYLAFNIKNMSFVKTRSYFSENKSMDDEFKKTIKSTNSDNGQNTPPTANSGDGA
jgi:hypothetical protein